VDGDGFVTNRVLVYCEHLPAFAEREPWQVLVPDFAANVSPEMVEAPDPPGHDGRNGPAWARLHIQCGVCGHGERLPNIDLPRIRSAARRAELLTDDERAGMWLLGARFTTTNAGTTVLAVPLRTLVDVRKLTIALMLRIGRDGWRRHDTP